MPTPVSPVLLPRPLARTEEAFSNLKAYLRRVGARTHEALFEAIAQAILTVTTQDALGWFTHCGYSVPVPAESPIGKRSEGCHDRADLCRTGDPRSSKRSGLFFTSYGSVSGCSLPSCASSSQRKFSGCLSLCPQLRRRVILRRSPMARVGKKASQDS